MSEYPKYFRCNKCGQSIIKAEDETQISIMCVVPVGYRVSGICGGSLTTTITEEQFNTQLQEWENKRKENV